MNNVLITGGTGFVGHWLAQTAPDGFTLDRMDRRAYFQILPHWFSDRYTKQYDYIIHAAPVAPSLVIKCARHNKARLLYVSSGVVYSGNDNEYRRNKIAWETECLQSVVDVVICRLFAFYGEKLSADHAIVAFENAAKKNEPLRIWGDGNTVRTYMSGEDMARRMWAALLRGERGECYDIGGTTPITMLELAKQIIRENKSVSEIIIENGKDPMPYYMPENAEKTERLLDK